MGVKCDAKAGVACESRRKAQREGAMYYSHRHGGWIFPADERAIPRVLREKAQAPFVFEWCPFCGEPLPDVITGIQKFLDPPKPWDNGEGAE